MTVFRQHHLSMMDFFVPLPFSVMQYKKSKTMQRRKQRYTEISLSLLLPLEAVEDERGTQHPTSLLPSMKEGSSSCFKSNAREGQAKIRKTRSTTAKLI